MAVRRTILSLSAVALVLQLGGAAAPVDRGPARVDVIVRFTDSGTDAHAVASDHDADLRFVYEHALDGFAGSVPEGRLNGLRRDPRVAAVELDQIATIAAQTAPTGIERVFADDNPNLDVDGSDDVRVDVDVAVLDSGIDLDHPDLNVVVSESVSCLHSSGGGPPMTRTYTCGAGGDDDNDHGTHVAGTIGAIDDGAGVVGVAPGARLWPVKVLDARGSGPISAIVAGIDHVTAHAAEIEVANMSLGCACSSDALDSAIATSVAAGVTYVVAAGNAAEDASGYTPADHPDVITVSALADFDGAPGGAASPTCRSDQDDTLADFSNFGPLVEIAAPGVCILSTVPGGGYDTFSGTSMASPHVAGAAAVLAASGSYSPAQIRTTLRNEGNLGWTDDADGVEEPLLDLSDAAVFDPATVAGGGAGGGDGGDGGGDPPPPPPGGFELTATGSKVKGVQHADLAWTGTAATDVDVRRDGAVVATTENDGSHTDPIGQRGGGSYTYTVCEAGTSTCSNAVTVTF